MTVVHCKRDEFDVYIGRPSKWGNPHRVGQCECGRRHNRTEAIFEFLLHLEAHPELLAQVGELRGQRLGCWCVPRSCHGHVLADLANHANPPARLAELIGREHQGEPGNMGLM